MSAIWYMIYMFASITCFSAGGVPPSLARPKVQNRPPRGYVPRISAILEGLHPRLARQSRRQQSAVLSYIMTHTTMNISLENRDELARRGKVTESLNDVLTRVLSETES